MTSNLIRRIFFFFFTRSIDDFLHSHFVGKIALRRSNLLVVYSLTFLASISRLYTDAGLRDEEANVERSADRLRAFAIRSIGRKLTRRFFGPTKFYRFYKATFSSLGGAFHAKRRVFFAWRKSWRRRRSFRGRFLRRLDVSARMAWRNRKSKRRQTISAY